MGQNGSDRVIDPAAALDTATAAPAGDALRRAETALAALEKRRGLPRQALDVMVQALEAEEPSRLRAWLAQRPPTPASIYLELQLLPHDPDDVADRWERLVGASPADPHLLLESARALTRAGRRELAIARLRQALDLHPAYSVFARAAPLVDELDPRSTSSPSDGRSLSPVRHARIALLGSSTTSLVVPVLRALCFRDRVDSLFYETAFGAYRQEVLDPSSGLHRFQPTIAFIMTSWRDGGLAPISPDEDREVERIVSECERVWKTLIERCGCHIVQHAFDLPTHESYDYLSGAPGGRNRILQRVNLELVHRAPGGVSILDQAQVQRETGSVWRDDRLWYTARQHPAPDALPALAELQMAHVRAVMGAARKVVVADLDNTMWGGVIGEDGLDGIRLGPDSHAGDAYVELQEYLAELAGRGVLLAVCSKNNPADARLPFERHPHMRLKLDDFAAFVANWDDKVQNLRAIAGQLSLGLDSFVVLDDNPFERAWIRAQIPEAAVVELGPSCFSYLAELDRHRYFFSLSLTDEDKRRAAQYRADAAARQMQASFASIDEFLAGLEMRAVASPIGEGNLARVVQLIGKTNQFNLTGRRHQRSDVERLLARPGSWGVAFSLSDRLSEHGLVSVILCAPSDTDTWEIDTWVMSCRVLGRGLESFAMEALHAAARRTGVKRLVGIYAPTPRNVLVGELFPKLGFTSAPTIAEATGAPDERRFTCDLTAAASSFSHYITGVTAA